MEEVNGQLIPKSWVKRSNAHMLPDVPRPGRIARSEVEKPGSMKLFHPYVSPNYAKDEQKPILDMTRPRSAFVEDDYDKCELAEPAMVTRNILFNHWIGGSEIVPYASSYSSGELFGMGWILANIHMVGKTFQLRNASNSNILCNPRQSWAYKTWWRLYLLRGNAAYFTFAGIGLYGYEFLYNFVPGFKIRDPSPEGYKRYWVNNNEQSTVRARIVSMWLATPLAYYVLKGSFAGSFNLCAILTLAAASWEWTKVSGAFSHTARTVNFVQNNTVRKRDQQQGSLDLEERRQIDAETDLPKNAQSIKTYYHDLREYFLPAGYGDASWYGKRWAVNAHLDYHPSPRPRVDNPLFNWQKVTQQYRDKPYRYHTDHFELPTVLSSNALYGVGDWSNIYKAVPAQQGEFNRYPNQWKVPVVRNAHDEHVAMA